MAAKGDVGGAEHPLPLTTAQLRWWVAQQLLRDIPVTVAVYLDLVGPLAVAVLRDCAELPWREEDLGAAEDPMAAAIEGIPFDAGAVLLRMRRTLPAPARPVYREPREFTQRLVAEHMGKATGHDRVGLDDDFFALGGDSLLGVTLRRNWPPRRDLR
ncbi:phosphopantetheine-binding protein [Nocardia arizonensis]|uniref:phosphopantetheine-binding protein n=1 Tax=Nocardia arizonensis TaxID=1141647 RepID=UPI0006D131FA|nr:phosphopantetheine-binding protein [Nocardia arizonensis]